MEQAALSRPRQIIGEFARQDQVHGDGFGWIALLQQDMGGGGHDMMKGGQDGLLNKEIELGFLRQADFDGAGL